MTDPNAIYDDLKARLITARDTLATARQLKVLAEDLELFKDQLTIDQHGELAEIWAEASAKANAEAVGEQKPSVICR